MTEAEALALKPGDRVFAVIGAGLYSGIGDVTGGKCQLRLVELVSKSQVGDRVCWLRLRRVGYDAKGRKFPVVERQPRRVLTPAEYKREFRQEPNLTPQVFADWLEEQGFIEASQALRARFPLATGD